MDVHRKKNDYSNKEIRDERRGIIKELQRDDLSREEKKAIHQQAEASLRQKKELRHSEDYGEHWIWRSFVPEHNFVVADVVGKRTRKECQLVVSLTQKRLDFSGEVLVVTDGLDTYGSVLKEMFALKVITTKQTMTTEYDGKWKRRSIKVPDEVIMPPMLYYVQSVKHRYPDGRLKNVEQRLVFGDKGCIATLLNQSVESLHVDTNAIERNNLTRRLFVAKLTRKSLRFAKDKEILRYQISLDRNLHNFCRTPKPLRREIPEQERTGKQKFHYRTPAMSIGITDHIWSLKELFMYVI